MEDKLKETIEHMLHLWDVGPVANDLDKGYTRGWAAALKSLARRMGVDL